MFGAEIANAVVAMTKQDGEAYDDYLSRVKANPLARAVKLKDLAHNMMMERLEHPGEDDLKRVEKYKAAVAFLNR